MIKKEVNQQSSNINFKLKLVKKKDVFKVHTTNVFDLPSIHKKLAELSMKTNKTPFKNEYRKTIGFGNKISKQTNKR